MRKIYHEYLYVPKEGRGKVREKVMVSRVVITIAVVLICLQAMCFSAYAYFSYNVTSQTNIIKAADFKTNIKVEIVNDGGLTIEAPDPITSNYKSYVIALTPGVEYKITVSPSIDSKEITGFCIITDNLEIENSTFRYHTQQMGNVENQPVESINFNVIANKQINLILFSHWGTSSFYGFEDENSDKYVASGETLQLNLLNTSNLSEGSSQNSQETNSNPPSNSESSGTGSLVSESSNSSAESFNSSIPHNALTSSEEVNSTDGTTTEPDTGAEEQ